MTGLGKMFSQFMQQAMQQQAEQQRAFQQQMHFQQQQIQLQLEQFKLEHKQAASPQPAHQPAAVHSSATKQADFTSIKITEFYSGARGKFMVWWKETLSTYRFENFTDLEKLKLLNLGMKGAAKTFMTKLISERDETKQAIVLDEIVRSQYDVGTGHQVVGKLLAMGTKGKPDDESLQSFSDRLEGVFSQLEELFSMTFPPLLRLAFFANMLPEWGPQWVASDPKSIADVLRQANNSGLGTRSQQRANAARSPSPHPRRDRKPCKFFKAGNCNRGESCTYLHDDSNAPNRGGKRRGRSREPRDGGEDEICTYCKSTDQRRYTGHTEDVCNKKKKALAEAQVKVKGNVGVFLSRTNQDLKNIWLPDTGASMHMTYNGDCFESMETDDTAIECANGQIVRAEGRGRVKLLTRTGQILTLNNVLYVPKINFSLVGVHQLCTCPHDRNHFAVDKRDPNYALIMTLDDKVLARCHARDGVYQFEATPYKTETVAAVKPVAIESQCATESKPEQAKPITTTEHVEPKVKKQKHVVFTNNSSVYFYRDQAPWHVPRHPSLRKSKPTAPILRSPPTPSIQATAPPAEKPTVAAAEANPQTAEPRPSVPVAVSNPAAITQPIATAEPKATVSAAISAPAPKSRKKRKPKKKQAKPSQSSTQAKPSATSTPQSANTTPPASSSSTVSTQSLLPDSATRPGPPIPPWPPPQPQGSFPFTKADALHMSHGHNHHFPPDNDCPVCPRAKQVSVSHPPSQSVFLEPLELISSDIIGPFRYGSYKSHKRFVVTFTDHATRFTRAFLIRRKSDALSAFQQFRIDAMNQFGRDIKVLRTDNGGEYLNRQFKNFTKPLGIKHEFTVPDTPAQNGVSERVGRTLFEMTRANLIQSGLSRKKFWVAALKAAVYQYNLNPHSAVDNKTPWELWYGRPYTGLPLQPWGCKSHLHIKKNHRQGKTGDVAIPAVLIGYDLYRKAYQLLTIERYPRTISSDDVSFPKTVTFPLLAQQSVNHISSVDERLTSLDDDDLLVILSQPDVALADTDDTPIDMDTDSEEVKAIFRPAPIESQPEQPSAVSNSTESVSAPTPVPAPSPSTTNTSTTSSSVPNTETKTDVDMRAIRGKMSESESRDNKPEPRYPRRVRRPKVNFGEWVLNAQRPRHFVGLSRVAKHDPHTPRTIEEAQNSPDWPHWKAAIEEELRSQGIMDAWDVVAAPTDKSIHLVKSGWIFKIKRDAKGNIVKYKARLIAKGYSQRYGRDFTETWAPVAQLGSIRTILALAAELDLDLHQFDVQTAFLHGVLPTPVYMLPPAGLNVNGVLLLKRGLYGLRQSAHVWNKTFTDALLRLGLTQCKSDPCIFTKTQGTSVLHLAVWVDDVVIATNDPQLREQLVTALRKEFRIPEIEELHWILGMRVSRDRSRRILRLDQGRYARSILERFELDGVTPKPTPVTPALHSPAPHPHGCKICEEYAEAVGALRYLTDCTRPDLAFAVNLACRFVKSPQPQHCVAVKRIFRYLAGTLDNGLVFEGSTSFSPTITAYADADYAGDPLTRRSTSGYLLTLAGSPVSWKSRLQRVVTTSTMEAEYLAIGDAAKDVLWLRALLAELGYKQPTTTIFNDNASAIHLTKHPTRHQTTKHIAVRYHFIRDLVTDKTVDVTHMPTAKMPADLLTKATSIQTFQTLISSLVRDVPR